ncbi:MAG: hypothetical protein H6709_02160 [Kofleriaceae bacterium]|nr:hypothetical protein [Kofleriaceae bacterium]
MRAWGFLVEHWASFRAQPGRLRVVDEAEGWDSRVRGLFAERIGMGVAAWLLWRDFGVVHIADAGPFLSDVLLDPSSSYHRRRLELLGKYGELRPDYFCLTSANEAVIAEAKGALGPPSSIPLAERLKAKQQVRNVEPVGVSVRPTEGRLVFATNLRKASDVLRGSGTDSGVYVGDPDDHEPDAIRIPVKPDRLVIHAYSKVLQFVGLGALGFFLRRGVRPLLPPEAPTETIEGEKLIVLAQAPGLRLGLFESVAKQVLNGSEDGLAERVGGALAESRLLSIAAEHGGAVERRRRELFVLPNGFFASSGQG